MHQPLLQCCCPLGSRHGSARIQGKTPAAAGQVRQQRPQAPRKCAFTMVLPQSILMQKELQNSLAKPSTRFINKLLLPTCTVESRRPRAKGQGSNRRTHRPQMESLHSISLVDTTANESQLQDHEIVLLLDIYRKVCSC